jgi:hypothetical protein
MDFGQSGDAIQHAADWNIDSVVDGLDFLAWQRGLAGGQLAQFQVTSNPAAPRDLASWAIAFGRSDAAIPISIDWDQNGQIDGDDFLAIQRDSSFEQLGQFAANRLEPTFFVQSERQTSSVQSAAVERAQYAARRDEALLMQLYDEALHNGTTRDVAPPPREAFDDYALVKDDDDRDDDFDAAIDELAQSAPEFDFGAE